MTFILIEASLLKENMVFSGVLVVLMTSLVLSQLEIRIRKRMPSTLDLALTNLISFSLALLIGLFVFTPLAKFMGILFSKSMLLTVYSDIAIVRMMTGFMAAALFFYP